MLEETGYEVSGRPVLHGLFLNRIAGGSRDHVAVYVWRQVRQVRPFKPNFEIKDCRWFDMNALPDDVGQGTRARIAEILGGLPPSLEWRG